MNALALTADEEANLQCAEETIERNLEGFRETGEALMLIRDNDLYRAEFKTFEEYCEKRWGFTKRYANYLISSDEVIKNLGTKVPVPKSETHVRPLAKLPKEEQAEAWEEAVETAPEGKITAKHVEQIVERRTNKTKTMNKKLSAFKREEQMSSEFRDAFEEFRSQILLGCKEGWRGATTKEAAMGCIARLNGLLSEEEV